MPSSLPIVFLDTCTLIGLLTGDADYVTCAGPYEADAKASNLTLAVSEITIAESCKLMSKHGVYQHDKVQRFLANDYTRRFPATGSVSERAASLIRLFGLDTCDALIIATAMVQGARAIVTRDTNSMCKKVRGSQKSPSELKADATVVNTDFDHGEIEKTVLDELTRLQFIVVTTHKPTASPPAALPAVAKAITP